MVKKDEPHVVLYSNSTSLFRYITWNNMAHIQ